MIVLVISIMILFLYFRWKLEIGKMGGNSPIRARIDFLKFSTGDSLHNTLHTYILHAIKFSHLVPQTYMGGNCKEINCATEQW